MDVMVNVHKKVRGSVLSIALASALPRLLVAYVNQGSATKSHALRSELMEAATRWAIPVARTRYLPRTSMPLYRKPRAVQLILKGDPGYEEPAR